MLRMGGIPEHQDTLSITTTEACSSLPKVASYCWISVRSHEQTYTPSIASITAFQASARLFRL